VAGGCHGSHFAARSIVCTVLARASIFHTGILLLVSANLPRAVDESSLAGRAATSLLSYPVGRP